MSTTLHTAHQAVRNYIDVRTNGSPRTRKELRHGSVVIDLLHQYAKADVLQRYSLMDQLLDQAKQLTSRQGELRAVVLLTEQAVGYAAQPRHVRLFANNMQAMSVELARAAAAPVGYKHDILTGCSPAQ